jgi:hypothetical protein
MDIETRIESLENDIRRQKDDLRLHRRLWMGAACLLAGALVLGATRPVPKEIVAKTIVAENFVVIDPSGKPRSTWAASKDGEVLFAMMDGKIPRMLIALKKEDVGMFISDSKGKVRFSAGMIKANSQKEPFPLIALYDKNGKSQVSVNAANREGTHSFQVLDPSGNQRASFGLTAPQGPSFVLRDAEGRHRSIFGLTVDGEPTLMFLDEKDEIYWVAPQELNKIK